MATAIASDRVGAGVPGAKRLKVLISAYACEPGKGSEPAVGWNAVLEAARHHEVWAITRANNLPSIQRELAAGAPSSLHMVYHDLPGWCRWWKRGGRGTRLYYYLWQLSAYRVARRFHRAVQFDVTHHVTFASYWTPTLLPLVPVPFLWGPIGGGESAPARFQRDTGWRGTLLEAVRNIARWCGERDPLVRMAARRCTLALASTDQTAQRLRRIGARRVRTLSQLDLSAAERSHLRTLGDAAPDQPVRFLSLGNLLHWKGFHLGLRAFAAAGLPGAEYWLAGDGPDRARLERMVWKLGIGGKVRFWGRLPRTDALRLLGLCHVVVHPSLHDSGAWVCIEAMAAGQPVLCLDLGGPGAHITPATGFKLRAGAPNQVVDDMASAMAQLAAQPALRARMGQAGSELVASAYARERKGELLAEIYRDIADSARDTVAGG
jgi:glycosyltransferase involved in cell wall biosynthesis